MKAILNYGDKVMPLRVPTVPRKGEIIAFWEPVDGSDKLSRVVKMVEHVIYEFDSKGEFVQLQFNVVE